MKVTELVKRIELLEKKSEKDIKIRVSSRFEAIFPTAETVQYWDGTILYCEVSLKDMVYSIEALFDYFGITYSKKKISLIPLDIK